jgi:hypothetical protein
MSVDDRISAQGAGVGLKMHHETYTGGTEHLLCLTHAQLPVLQERLRVAAIIISAARLVHPLFSSVHIDGMSGGADILVR